MVTGKFLSGNDELSEVYRIRYQVFCEEQQIPEEIERDALDNGAIHVLIHDHGCNVATGRLLIQDTAFSIGRVAVLKEERGKYYGDFVVRMLVDKAFRIGAKEVSILAQEQTVPFYEKIGFKIDGEPITVCKIVHIPMKITGSMMCHCKSGK